MSFFRKMLSNKRNKDEFDFNSERMQRSCSTPSLRKNSYNVNINKKKNHQNFISSNQNRRFSELSSLKLDSISDSQIKEAIQLYQNDDLKGAANHLRIAAERESPIGMFLYGIALRHGWVFFFFIFYFRVVKQILI